MTDVARVMAGNPQVNKSLYRAIRFMVHDAAIAIDLPDGTRTLILREIEMDRAKKHARADHVFGYSDFTPSGGLSGDRDTAAAQSTAECLRRNGITTVIADRTLPLMYVHFIEAAGMRVNLDQDMGVLDRRVKDAEELDNLRQAQKVTEDAMRMACETVAGATSGSDGVLHTNGTPLTSQRLRTMIDTFLLEQNFFNPPCIVAGGSDGGDCHELGSGELFTEQPVIIDIFPLDKSSMYNGDCTRTVVHGNVPDEIIRMHAAVAEAKQSATSIIKAGVAGEEVHLETIRVLKKHGYVEGLPKENDPPTFCSMPHGTGHGIGLDVHEPPLLDRNGAVLLAGDVVTIEPGLYSHALGGVRIEDMVVVTEVGCENFNSLPEGLTWC
ncbi:MAG: aminopeptidase P family protein [Phycisphaerae bacterium]|jgi:Xaa-Pro aminopeptidase|nr:aminopeptidase P family protein [Phycisphaerae bacterium]HJN71049.1 Xaa-Pro peptidase family protein [Phycisphaerales bacterium]|tara:strand:+ start:3447 stop:4592 length:1146 start_codon:yes stop_codon:yes gene_type:complete